MIRILIIFNPYLANYSTYMLTLFLILIIILAIIINIIGIACSLVYL